MVSDCHVQLELRRPEVVFVVLFGLFIVVMTALHVVSKINDAWSLVCYTTNTFFICTTVVPTQLPRGLVPGSAYERLLLS